MNKPLTGKRVVVTRSIEQAKAMCALLESSGATAVRFPVIDFVPLPAPELEEALENLQQYDWLIFTSGNAVRFFFNRLAQTTDYRLPITNYQLRIAAVGSATQQLLAEKGIPISFVPDEFTAEQLTQGLGDVAGKRILLPRARIGRPEIVNRLRKQGATMDDIALYETVTAVPTPQAWAELEKGIDVLTFTSPSSVRNFCKLVAERPDRFLKTVSSAIVAVIGPSTAEEAEKYGVQVDIMPKEYTIEALVTAVAHYFVNTDREEQAEEFQFYSSLSVFTGK